MLKFSDWTCISSGRVNIWRKKIQNINSIFELSIHHYIDYSGSCTLYITYNSETLSDAFKLFSKSKFKENENYCFDDVESAKLYVEHFESFLQKCMKLVAFL